MDLDLPSKPKLQRNLPNSLVAWTPRKIVSGRALRGDEIVGSISIDGENLENGQAHLRWFVVSNTIRGGGVGGALLDAAIEFCDSQGYHECHLWTVKGLDAARSLYERKGFVLAEEYRGDQWGDEVLEQKFVRSVG